MNDTLPPAPSGLRPGKPRQDGGSLGSGIGQAWAIAVVGTPLCIAVASMLNTGLNTLFAAGLLPYLLIIVLAIAAYRKGRPRTGQGLLLGLLSIFAVGLLLVAACFGMLAHL